MELLTLEQAAEILLGKVNRIEEQEEISLWNAAGRILAQDVTAQRDQPPFPRSPLDGYAVQSQDLQEAEKEHPAILTVIDEVTAGHVSGKLVSRGTAVRIMTGAPIPEGADCVVRQEDTDYGEETVRIYQKVGAYQNYCFMGEDYRAGTKLLAKDMVLGSVEIGTLASLGMETVQVYRRPCAAVITTGDETVLPGEQLTEGKIYDSNLYTLVTRLTSLGVEVTDRGKVEDDPTLAAARIEKAARRADIIITTGGVSVGKKDIMHEVLKLLACERLFWRVAVKPGMPTLCGLYQGKLLICLTGNPYGAAVNLELLVRPVLAKLSVQNSLALQRKRAVSESAFPKPSPVTRYVRARYEDGHVRKAEGSNDSGILSNMCGCNCLIEIPAGTQALKKGDQVWVVML